MISRKTIFIVLLVLFVVDMIQAGVVDDIAEAVHFDDIKKFTQTAAHKTGEAATNAYHSVKNFFTPNSEEGAVASVPAVSKTT